MAEGLVVLISVVQHRWGKKDSDSEFYEATSFNVRGRSVQQSMQHHFNYEQGGQTLHLTFSVDAIRYIRACNSSSSTLLTKKLKRPQPHTLPFPLNCTSRVAPCYYFHAVLLLDRCENKAEGKTLAVIWCSIAGCERFFLDITSPVLSNTNVYEVHALRSHVVQHCYHLALMGNGCLHNHAQHTFPAPNTLWRSSVALLLDK